MFCKFYRNSWCVASQYRVLANHLISKQMFACQSPTVPVIAVFSHNLLMTLASKMQCSYFSIMTNETSDQKVNDAKSNKQSESDCTCSNATEIDQIQQIFQCTLEEAAKLHEYFLTVAAQNDDSAAAIRLETINKTVKWLMRKGASMPIIIGNCHILFLPIEKLKQRYERLCRSKWKHVDDFLPLLTVNEDKMRTLQLHQSHAIRDRTYFLSKQFSIEPHVISHYCSKHLFIFEIEMELLKRKLDMILLDNAVSPENILRDLNVLARSEDVIRERLEYIKKCGVKRVMPWMIKCEIKILTRSIELRQLRGPEQNKMLEHLAEKLHWHGQKANSIYNKNRFLQNMDYNTVSKLLDELLKIFSPEEITANIGLLSHSIEHIKIRVAELTTLKNEHISPNLLNMSESKFKNYLNTVKNK